MIKIGTLFTGIGAFEEGLEQLKVKYKTIFASDNGERYLKPDDDNLLKNNPDNKLLVETTYAKYGRNFVKETYTANFGDKLENWYEDVRYLNANKYNDIDILVGGSPCQAFSSIGKRKGFEDARGTLFFEYARIVNESKPKYFIYENVPGIMTIDEGKTWKRILEIFNGLNYNYKVLKLNAKDYGLPQSRNRVFVVGKRMDLGNITDFNFKKVEPGSANDYLEPFNDIEKKYFMGQKGFEFVTNPKYSGRATINRDILRTLKATQQYNWNGNFIFYKTNKFLNDDKIHTGIWKGETGVVRKMTPRELLRLMGFRDKYILPDHPAKHLYRHSGNSIAVNVIKLITKEILEDLNEKN